MTVLIVKNDCEDLHRQLMTYIKLHLMHVTFIQLLIHKETLDCPKTAHTLAYVIRCDPELPEYQKPLLSFVYIRLGLLH